MLKKLAVCFFALHSFFIRAQDKNYEFGNVTVKELQEEFYPLDSTAHAAYLYKEQVLRYSYGVSWSHETSFYEKIKIYDEEGFDWATKKIFLFNSEEGSKERVSKIEAYTYVLENGNVKKMKLNKKDIFEEDGGGKVKQKKFTMPGLKKGAIVEWKYKVTSPFVLHIDRLVLQEDIPIKKYSGILSIPEYFVFKLYKTGVLPIEVSKFSRDMKVLKGEEKSYVIELDSIPAFQEEVYMSNRKNFISSLDFDLSHVEYPGSKRKHYAMGTWDEVAKQVFKSSFFGKSLKKKKYFEEDFLTLELEGKSDKDKIAIVLKHVKSKIKWNNEERKDVNVGVKKAYETGEGNSAEINLVLTAMLNRAGFKASPVLVSTRANGVSLFPSIKAYNYVITAVEGVDEIPILLDATEEYSYLNVLPFRDVNWYGRLIREDLTSEDIYLNPRVYSVESEMLNVRIQEDLGIKGVLKTVYMTQNAMSYRKKTNHLSEQEHKNHVKDKYKIEVESLLAVSKEDLKNPYSRVVNFAKSDAVEEINNKLYVEPLFFLRTKTSPFKLDKRDYPVDFAYPWKDEFRVIIEIPENYNVEYLPKEGHFDIVDNIGSYSYQVAQNGRLLSVFFSIQFNTGVIAPKYYEELKELYKNMIAKQAEKIVLVKKD